MSQVNESEDKIEGYLIDIIREIIKEELIKFGLIQEIKNE